MESSFGSRTSVLIDMESIFSSKLALLAYSVLIFLGLYATRIYSYLLFHCLVEFFSVIIAFGIFMVAWNSRRFMENQYLLIIGVSYFFVGSMDMLHAISYKGMGIFSDYDADLPTQLWIAARYMESLSLFIAPFLGRTKINISFTFTVYSAVTLILYTTIFGRIFPVCYVEGQGLTWFKISSEYVIALILIGAIVFLSRQKQTFAPSVFRRIMVAIGITVLSEMIFTLYASVYDIFNLIGHYFKFISFYLVYKAIIETGFERPYELMFRDLKKSEAALRREKEYLQHALDEIKLLKGILPICSGCKKVRKDDGYWTQIEAYIQEHSDVDFSHSLCPECAKKIYPDIKLYKD